MSTARLVLWLALAGSAALTYTWCVGWALEVVFGPLAPWLFTVSVVAVVSGALRSWAMP